MTRIPGAALAALFLVASLTAHAQAPEDMETVLVTGEQPGPGLWKVSRDGHVMWVLGTIGEVPDTIEWRTREVEARIAESQEVLYPGWPSVNLDVSVFQALTLVPAAFKAAKNPDGARLKDVLSAEDYATWLRLKQKYLGNDDDIEKYRPMVAEDKLNTAIGKKKMKKLRMTWVDDVVRKAAKKHKVRIHELPYVVRKIKVEKPRAILKAARNLDLAEGECVGRNLARIERADAKGLLEFNVAEGECLGHRGPGRDARAGGRQPRPRRRARRLHDGGAGRSHEKSVRGTRQRSAARSGSPQATAGSECAGRRRGGA